MGGDPSPQPQQLANSDALAHYEANVGPRLLYSSLCPRPSPNLMVEDVCDSQTGILRAYALSARCVQRLDDSQIHANRINFRISLRSSSLQEPRDPLLKVVSIKRF